jgi:putative ABC transport system permease protein
MTLLTIVLKNLAQRRLSSTLTALSIALGVSVTVGVLALKEQSHEGFQQSAFGYDLVVGAKGSKLQLVLNTVYHLDQSTGNIPYALYARLKTDRRVRLAVPMAVGDFYQGFRLVGASDKLLTDFEVQKGQKFELAQGRVYAFDEKMLEHLMTAPPDHVHEHEGQVFEAVLGSIAAERTGLTLGSAFVAQHGSEEGQAHEEKWTVVGILKPTGTANDRAIFINLESFFHIKGHQKEEVVRGKISTIVLKTKGPMAAKDLAWEINNGVEAMGGVPAEVVVELFDLIGKVDVLLLAVSVLVIVVAGVSILVSIYNSMAERRRPIAIMRALGARRGTIFAVIVMEASALCLIGGLVGLLGGHVLTAVAGGILKSAAGVVVSPWSFSLNELWVLAGLQALGALVGVVPAAKAYRTDIADGLSPTA